MDDAKILANAREIFNERRDAMSAEISLCERHPGHQAESGLDTFPIQQLCRKLKGRVKTVLQQYQERVPSLWPQVEVDSD